LLDDPPHNGPAVARVSIRTLLEIRRAFITPGDPSPELLATIDHLIEAARWNAEAL